MGMRRAVAACTSPEVFFGSAPLPQPYLTQGYAGITGLATDPLNLALEALNLSDPMVPVSSFAQTGYSEF